MKIKTFLILSVVLVSHCLNSSAYGWGFRFSRYSNFRSCRSVQNYSSWYCCTTPTFSHSCSAFATAEETQAPPPYTVSNSTQYTREEIETAPVESVLKIAASAVDRLISAAISTRGCGFSIDPTLSAMAKRNSELQARYCRCGHFANNMCYEIAAEASSPEEAVSLWLRSPEHAQILLNRGFTKAGAAVSKSANGNYFYTMCFR